MLKDQNLSLNEMLKQIEEQFEKAIEKAYPVRWNLTQAAKSMVIPEVVPTSVRTGEFLERFNQSQQQASAVPRKFSIR